MIFSRSAIRRYTPPTCTLQVTAKKSPLQAWTSRPLFENARFELRFDDPRQLESQQVVLTGNSEQLEALYQAVSDYVQNFLYHSTPARLTAYVATSGSEGETESVAVPGLLASDSKFVTRTPTVQPLGLLSHKLYFGDLATEKSDDGIPLSATQLFDLATALENYHTEMTVLPNLPPPRPAIPLRTWGSAVAGVIVAVGLTATVITVMDNTIETSETAIEPLTESDSEERISEIPTLPNPPVEPIPLPTVPDNLASGDQLPPPPAVNRSPGSPNAPDTVETVPRNNSENRTTTQLPTSPDVSVQPRPTQNPPAAIPPGNDPAANIPSLGDSVPQAPLPDIQPQQPNAPESLAEALGQNRPNAPESVAEALGQNRSNAPESSTARDNIPQTNQIQSYFEQNWQPPDNLEEELRYRLIVNTDGTLKRIIPLSTISGRFIDRTPMPLLGTDFGITPPSNNATPQIRVVLRPDGGVETVLE
ncbi:MAG: DUF4335 domain-containing protein [Spirulinaceae cyanobacterium]